MVGKQAIRHADVAADALWADELNPVTRGAGSNLTAGAVLANRALDVSAAGVGVDAQAVAAAVAKQVDATITPVVATLQQIVQALATATTAIGNVVNQAQPKGCVTSNRGGYRRPPHFFTGAKTTMNILLIILQIFPLVLAAVQAVEQAIPLPGQGNKKLELVLDVVKSGFDASADLAKQFGWEKLLTLVVPMIARIVSLHNALGLFNKPAAQPTKA
jgi:hypothetical protein